MGIIIITMASIVPAVALLLFFTSRDHYLAGFFKMLASTGFILLCITSGGVHSAYGWVILGGLICSWWGDFFLISQKRPIFLLGLIAFFLAHGAYCAAFIVYGVDISYVLGTLLISLIPGVFLLRWMYPHLGSMRFPVLAYMAIITVMVCLAAGATFGSGGALIIVGALLFYVSDIFVARDRFVAPGKSNAYLGLPLYFLAQVLLALSTLYTR